MQEWLTAEVLLGTLLITTFTCVGILALWVTASPRHWFVRVATSYVLLSPFLLVPAYGPFVTFWLIIVFVIAGVGAHLVWRHRRSARHSGAITNAANQQSRWQFSVKTCLAVCTCVAVIVATAVRLPAETWTDWEFFAPTAIVAAIVTLVAAWTVNGKGTCLERTGSAIAFVLVLVECITVAAKHDEVRIQTANMAMSAYFSIHSNPIVLFVASTIGTFIALWSTLQLGAAANLNRRQPSTRTMLRNLARLALIPWSLLMLAPPILMLAALLQPLPIVDTALPTPNGYDELARIGERLKGSAIERELAADVVDDAKLDAAVPQYETDFIAIRNTLNMPFRIPIRYSFDDLAPTPFMAIHDLGFALDAKADATRRAGNIDESLACRIDQIRLARSIEHSGVLVHLLIAEGFEADEVKGIYHTLPAMNSAQCISLLTKLVDFDQNREKFENVHQRELVWIAKTTGWMNYLGCLMDSVINPKDNDTYRLAYLRHQVVFRLLIVEVALHAYQLDHGRFPEKLDNLVPTYLTELPNDPCSPKPARFHYITTPNKFKLWSVGSDGNDDNGAPLPKDEDGYVIFPSVGDLWLEDYFAHDNPSKIGSENDAKAAGPRVAPDRLDGAQHAQ